MNNKWIVAVSGGVDSMALLDMCVKKHMDIIVAHVNYHKRESALRDEKGVEAYCLQQHIPFFTRDMLSYDNTNFQAQARRFRYQFFQDLANEFEAQGVLVAHHLDDVIETYIMQKRRNSIPSFYGVKESTTIYGVHVKRTLLGYTKEELKSYCEKHNVTYYEDESNKSNAYTRNRIRHEIIEHLSKNEKLKYMEEIQHENIKLSEQQEIVSVFFGMDDTTLDVKKLLSYARENQFVIVYAFIKRNTKTSSISKKLINEILDMFQKGNTFKKEINGYTLQQQYGICTLNKSKPQGFSYTYDTITYVDTEYFKLKDKGETIQGCHLEEHDFPITIRNARAGDKIKLRMGSKRVSRFFIDRKIRSEERLLWPVIVNNMGEIIFVCGIGCDIAHYSTNFNVFMIK